jgi:tRNA (guanine37-N1)-methyltransferase
MVMRADILEKALLHAFSLASLESTSYDRSRHHVVTLSAAGTLFTQSRAVSFTKLESIFFVCGHYEGIDQRFIDHYSDSEISIGEYVLTGGELPAAVIADSVVRLLPNALGDSSSSEQESFSLKDERGVLLEYPHYTRPAVFNGVPVPDVLLSGNHKAITDWRFAQSREITDKRRSS